MSVRCVAAEDLVLEDGEEPYDLVFAIRVGALDGRHPAAGIRALQRIAAVTTPGRPVVRGRRRPAPRDRHPAGRPVVITVRPAVAEDVDAVWPLARDLATSYEVDHDTYATIFAGLVAEPTVVLLVATDDGAVVGYLLGQRHVTFHAGGPVVWVEEVMVDGERRGTGVGRALMEAAEERARDERCRVRGAGHPPGRGLLRRPRLPGIRCVLQEGAPRSLSGRRVRTRWSRRRPDRPAPR